MFTISNPLHLVLFITLIAFNTSNARAEEEFINQTANASIVLYKTQYKITAPLVDENVKSDTVKFKFSYSKLLNLKFVLFSTAQVYQVTMADSATGLEKKELMGGVEAGVRYFINSRWSATASAEFQRYVSFQTNNGGVVGGGHWTPALSAAAYYQALSRANYSVIPSLKASLLMGTGQAKMGASYLASVTYNYYLPIGRLNAGLGFESRTQESETAKLTESGLQLTLGVGKSF